MTEYSDQQDREEEVVEATEANSTADLPEAAAADWREEAADPSDGAGDADALRRATAEQNERYEETGRELHEQVRPEQWKESDFEERAELAREMHGQIRDRYGLDPQELTISSELGDRDSGCCHPTTGEVTVNESLLSSDRPEQMIETLAHENRHSLQVEVLSGRREHPHGDVGAAQIQDWRRGEEKYDADFDSPDFEGEGYLKNPLELDARDAEKRVARGYRNARTEEYREEREEQRRNRR